MDVSFLPSAEVYAVLMTDIEALQARARPLVERYLEHIREEKAMEVGIPHSYLCVRSLCRSSVTLLPCSHHLNKTLHYLCLEEIPAFTWTHDLRNRVEVESSLHARLCVYVLQVPLECQLISDIQCLYESNNLYEVLQQSYTCRIVVLHVCSY